MKVLIDYYFLNAYDGFGANYYVCQEIVQKR